MTQLLRESRLLSDLLANASAAAPDARAVRCGDTELTYGELADQVARLAAWLRDDAQVAAGDRVCVMLPNVPEFVVAYHAIQRAGAVVVPMNVLLRRREIEYYLRDSGARLLLVWDGFAAEAEPAAAEAGTRAQVLGAGGLAPLLGQVEPLGEAIARDAGDTAVILYTSGTTGQPKGAELTHANMVTNAQVSTELFALGPDDVFLGALPLFHSFGQTCAMNASISAGASLVLLPRFDAAVALELLEREHVTVFAGVPTMYGALLAALEARRGEGDQPDLGSLRVCASGGASLPVELLRRFEDAFGCMILEGYGLSETSPVASFNHPDRERRPGTVGTAIRGVELRAVDEHDEPVATGEIGELVIRGHNVMRGYWQREDATAEAMRGGWFHSGDLGTIDEDGYIRIVDRSKDMIIRGGYNVYPREVEEVLYEHPAVLEAAVLGVDDEHLGQEVAAAVALRAGAEATPEELREWVKERLAAFKYPRHVWLVDALPKTATGKILKREIEPPADLR